MRIKLFTHDANPSVDAPLCHKSKSYIADLIVSGAGFMLDDYRAQLYAPRSSHNRVDKAKRPALVPGRNSCRKVGREDRGDTIYFKVQGFSYPVPACGARSRQMYVSVINKVPKVPVEVTA